MQEIIAQDIKEHPSSFTLIDIREPWEFVQGHIDGAKNVPLKHFIAQIDEMKTEEQKPTVIYCQTGNRTTFAAQLCDAKGKDHILHYKGGYSDWVKHDD